MINKEAIRRTSLIAGLFAGLITALLVGFLWLSPCLQLYTTDAYGNYSNKFFDDYYNDAYGELNKEQYAQGQVFACILITILTTAVASAGAFLATRYTMNAYLPSEKNLSK